MKKNKLIIYVPKTINEAISDLHEFLDCDIWSKFYPEHKIPEVKDGKKIFVKMYRKDVFRNEKEFIKYLQGHFDILRKQIKYIQRKERAKEKAKQEKKEHSDLLLHKQEEEYY